MWFTCVPNHDHTMKMFSFWGNQAKSWKNEPPPHMYNNNNIPNLKLFFPSILAVCLPKDLENFQALMACARPFLQGRKYLFYNKKKTCIQCILMCQALFCFPYIGKNSVSFNSPTIRHAPISTEQMRKLRFSYTERFSYTSKVDQLVQGRGRIHAQAIWVPSLSSSPLIILLYNLHGGGGEADPEGQDRMNS